MVGLWHDHVPAAFARPRQAALHAPLIRSLTSVAASFHFLRVHFASPLDARNSRRCFSVKSFSLLPDDYKPAFAPRQDLANFIANLPGHEQVPSLLLRLAPLHNNFTPHVNGLQVFHRQFRRHCANLAKPADFPHRLIQKRRDNSAMRKSCAALVPLSQNKPSDNPPVHVVLLKLQFPPAVVAPAAPKTLVHWIRRQRNRLAQSFRSLAHFSFPTSLLHFIKPAPLGCVPPGGLRAAVCAFQSLAIPPAWPRRAQSAFHPGSQSPAAAYSAPAPARSTTLPAQTTTLILY